MPVNVELKTVVEDKQFSIPPPTETAVSKVRAGGSEAGRRRAEELRLGACAVGAWGYWSGGFC